MDINLQRYCDSIGIRDFKTKKTFLKRWFWRGFNTFYKIYKQEFDDYELISSDYYKKETAKGIHGMDVVASDDYEQLKKKYDPVKRHKVMYFMLVRIPQNIQSWLCCGWKLKYVRPDGIHKGYWTWIDRYHMMTKLCRYGSPMWPEYKFTWWDKLRFKWITGYKYKEVK